MHNPSYAPVIVDREYKFSAPARWIQMPGTENLSHTMYRRSFQLLEAPANAVMLLMAANMAEVFINGREVALYVVRSYVFDTIYQVYDVGEYLRPGRNVVTVRNVEARESKLTGFVLEIRADNRTVCCTDGDWRCCREAALTHPVNFHIMGGAEEVVDGAKLLRNFADPDLNDDGWDVAAVLSDGLTRPLCDRFRQSRIQGQTWDVCHPVSLAAVMYTEKPAGYDLMIGPASGSVSLGMTCMTVDRDTQLMLSDYGQVDSWAIDGTPQPKNQWVGLRAGRYFVNFVFSGTAAFYLCTDAGLTFTSPAGEADPLAVYGINAPKQLYPWNQYSGPDAADMYAQELLRMASYGEMPDAVRANAVSMAFGRRESVIHDVQTRAYTVPKNGFAQPNVYNDKRITNSNRIIEICKPDNLLEPEREAVIGVHAGGVNIVLDFGEEKVGRVAFEVDAPAGTMLDLQCFEMINDAGIYYMEGPMTLRYICQEGAQEYISRRRRGFRYISLNVSGNTGEVRLKNVRVIEQRYPVERGAFFCSDPRMNRIYDMSVRTAEVCMLETYVDCPGYEQNPWTGDARCTGSVNLYNFGEYDFDAQYLKLIGQSVEEGVCRAYRSRNPRYQAGMYLPCGSHPTYPEGCIPVWSFMWLLHVDDHYQHTGDKKALADVFYAVGETLSRCEKMTDSRGLFDMQGAWNLIEWANNDLDFYGEVTANNVMLAHCFGRAAELAEVLDQPELAAHYRKQQCAYRDAVNAYCWSETDRAYVDTVRDAYAYRRYCEYMDARGMEKTSYDEYLKKGRISVQSNTMALLYDIVPEDRRADAMRFLLDNMKTGIYVSGTPANRTAGVPDEEEAPDGYVHLGSPFFMFFALDTLYKFGYNQLALEAQRQAWGEFLDSGLTTCLETFKKGDTWTRSIAHAWSASPAVFMMREVLGVKPVKPGFAEFTVTPKTDGLEFAQGSVPTPYGRIFVAWKKDEDGRVSVTCTAPAECRRV